MVETLAACIVERHEQSRDPSKHAIEPPPLVGVVWRFPDLGIRLHPPGADVLLEQRQ
jgi:hypothetical protein